MARKVVCTAGIYLLKVDDVNTRTMCEFFSKLIITTLKRRDLRHSGVLASEEVNTEWVYSF